MSRGTGEAGGEEMTEGRKRRIGEGRGVNGKAEMLIRRGEEDLSEVSHG